jgi:predicted dehydrogenase
MDVGIYSLNACRYLTGEEPASISAYSSVIDHDGRFNEVEENVSWTMKFPSGIVASCNTTYGASMDGYYRVHGSKGWLQLSPALDTRASTSLRISPARARAIPAPTSMSRRRNTIPGSSRARPTTLPPASPPTRHPNPLGKRVSGTCGTWPKSIAAQACLPSPRRPALRL